MVGVEMTKVCNERNADVDGDGSVTIRDVLIIQRYLVGLIDKFPAEA